jgi:hypothetical protein
MEDREFLFMGKSIQDLRGALTTLRRTGAARLRRVRRWRRWFVRGAIVGVIWAVLYAPQSGAQTRAALGKQLRPLALTGWFLLAALQRQQRLRTARMAARRASGKGSKATEEEGATRHTEETSGAGDAPEDVGRSVSRSR